MQEQVLESQKNKKLKVYAVWTPVLLTDSRESAQELTQLIPDARSVHFWDADTSLGLDFANVVELPHGRSSLAWDVYMTYAANDQWKERPPAPTNWMHQLGASEIHKYGKDKRWLDGPKLRATVEKLLEGVIPAAQTSSLERNHIDDAPQLNKSLRGTRMSDLFIRHFPRT